jgi:hypothetical protein
MQIDFAPSTNSDRRTHRLEISVSFESGIQDVRKACHRPSVPRRTSFEQAFSWRRVFSASPRSIVNGKITTSRMVGACRIGFIKNPFTCTNQQLRIICECTVSVFLESDFWDLEIRRQPLPDVWIIAQRRLSGRRGRSRCCQRSSRKSHIEFRKRDVSRW